MKFLASRTLEQSVLRIFYSFHVSHQSFKRSGSSKCSLRVPTNLNFLKNLNQLGYLGRENLEKLGNIEIGRSRSSRQEVFFKKGILRNFAKFTGKRLCQSLFFDKVAGLRQLKKRPWLRCFPVNFVKFLRTPFRTEHLQWLLLFFCLCYFPYASLYVIDLNLYFIQKFFFCS